jgi:hypothetical protein
MAIQRTTPVAFTAIGTTLNSLGIAAAAQTNEVSSGTSSNITQITARWEVAVGAITASASTLVNVYVWGTVDDTGYPGSTVTNDIVTGTAGAITISALGTNLKWLGSTLAHTASATHKGEAEITSALGFIPRRWGLVFQNATGVALAASGHTAEYVETYYN